MVLLNLQTSTKLLGNFIILKTFLSTISTIIHFFIEQKFCKYYISFINNIFYGAEKNKLKRCDN